jgi:exopolysaccharide production protein ExoZ
MWLILLLNLVIIGSQNSWFTEFLIYTGLFSICDWSASTPLGMWSIGNELSFYLVFPILMLILAKTKHIGSWMLIVLTLSIHSYFAFFMFGVNSGINEDWAYKHPLNQLFFFAGGVVMGYFSKCITTKNSFWAMLLLLAVAAFIVYPLKGELNLTFQGIHRLSFSFISVTIVLFCFKFDFDFLPPAIKRLLQKLGDISYTLYLSHGLIWSVLVLLGLKIRYVLPLAITLTFIISSIIHTYIEMPIKKFGYQFIKR